MWTTPVAGFQTAKGDENITFSAFSGVHLPDVDDSSCPVRSSYGPYCFDEETVFFSNSKLVNNTFSHGFSAK
jgi:hypothetical protein